jgi:hypothetical protein
MRTRRSVCLCELVSTHAPAAFKRLLGNTSGGKKGAEKHIEELASPPPSHNRTLALHDTPLLEDVKARSSRISRCSSSLYRVTFSLQQHATGLVSLLQRLFLHLERPLSIWSRKLREVLLWEVGMSEVLLGVHSIVSMQRVRCIVNRKLLVHLMRT